jgi:hypothetical protein
MDSIFVSFSEGYALGYNLRQDLLLIVSPEVGCTESLVAS